MRWPGAICRPPRGTARLKHSASCWYGSSRRAGFPVRQIPRPIFGGGDFVSVAVSSGSSPCLEMIFSAIPSLTRISAIQIVLGAVLFFLGTARSYRRARRILPDVVPVEGGCYVACHERRGAGAVPRGAARRGPERGGR